MTPHNWERLSNASLKPLGWMILLTSIANVFWFEWYEGSPVKSSIARKHNIRLPLDPVERAAHAAISLSTTRTTTTTLTIDTDTVTNIHSHHPPDPSPLPPLSSLVVNNWTIVSNDTSWLLHFAVVGFPKCGTSTLMELFVQSRTVAMFPEERCDLAYNQQAALIRDLHATAVNQSKELGPSEQKLRGLKCPLNLENTKLGVRAFNQYFPQTDFIVGIRHPILWLESFYNHRIQNGYRMLPIEALQGKCQRGNLNVCTFRANFHIFLYNLGLTPGGAKELEYMDKKYHRSIDRINPIQKSRRVFVYEVSQLQQRASTTAKDREVLFRADLQRYLGLQEALPSLPWVKPGITRHANDTFTAAVERRKVNICDDTHAVLRKSLLEQAVNVSRWMREYFLEADNVYASSKDYLKNVILAGWEVDPCIARIEKSQRKIEKERSEKERLT